MARDWSTQRRRDQTRTARRCAIDDTALFDDAPEPGPSKAQLRAEGDALVAAYRGPIRRLPTYAALRCRSCGHRGTARVPPGVAPRFRCSRCSSPLVTVTV